MLRTLLNLKLHATIGGQMLLTLLRLKLDGWRLRPRWLAASWRRRGG
jgi:hypothetical protein